MQVLLDMCYVPNALLIAQSGHVQYACTLGEPIKVKCSVKLH